MKLNRKSHSSSSSTSTSTSTSTVTYTFNKNDNSTLPQPTETPITVHFHDHHHSLAAAKIQAAYRSYIVRTLLKKITAVKSEIDNLECLIQRQETVDAVRSSEKEKMKINEALMVQLLKLDSVPGFDHGVRMMRKNVSRRIVGLQEVMDGICGGDHHHHHRGEMDGWDLWKGWDYDDGFCGIEEKVCREKGGDELDKFCELNLGFRCLERFLREA